MNSIESKSPQKDNAAWPISPSFLVKPEIPKNETFSPNKHGIYTSDTVRGLVADASDDPGIKNPLSLFQVVPESYKPEEFDYIEEINPAKDDSCLKDILKGKKIIRIDPKILYQNKPCCDKFRECNGYENKCHEQDCRIALLYHKDLEGIHYTDNFKEYYNRLIKIIDEYNQEIAKAYPLHCEQDEENNRLYVWYQCPYSQFLEYFFPIIHAGKVIAVLMQGQRIPKEGLNQENLFKEVLADDQVHEDKKENLRQSIKESIKNDESGEDPMPESRLNAIWKRIRSLEERIDREVMAYARAYVSDNFHRIEEQFHQQIKNEINPNGELEKAVYTKIVNGTLQEICDIFNKEGFIRIYSTESEFEEVKSDTDTFYLIGAYPELTKEEKQNWGKIKFQNLPPDSKDLEAMKNKGFKPHLSYYVYKKITFNEDVIFRIESLSIGNTKHLIWKEYPKKKDIDQKQFEEFSKFLKTFYHTLWEPYNLLQSVELRKNLETSMRVSVHETSQIIPVIINTLETEYNKLIPDISKNKQILYDTIHRLLLLDNLYRRSTLMFKELTPQTEWTDLHRLIYSVRSLCDEKAKKDNMQKIIVWGDGFKINQYKIYTDYQLVSHALFNLIDNAIKYGYMGSNIRINISLSEADLQNERNGNWKLIKAIQISIVSYGAGISEEDGKHIYELFYRSQASKVKEGMGIGLFLVKKICSSLGYTVEYKSEKLSKYNLPMYYHGKRQNKTAQLKDVFDSLIEEAVNQDLSAGAWSIEDFEFQAAINQPTYRNEFTVTLNPINNNLIKPI